MSQLSDKVLAIHGRLTDASIPHAIGGAIALAYHTGEPRATVDVDMNVFVGTAQAERVLDALAGLVEASAADRDALERDGQVRLFWDDTAVDLFFATVPFHAAAAARLEHVEFFGQIVPILSAADLAVCKAVFSRDKDWADLRAMAEAGTVDLEEVRRWIGEILGAGSPTAMRLVRLFGEVEAEQQAGGPALPSIPSRRPL